VLTDRRVSTYNSGLLTSVSTDISSWSDYFSFGWEIPGRSVDLQDARNTFNGKELDREWDRIDFEARPYNRKTGRFEGTDIYERQAPNWTPYRYAFDGPIQWKDDDGNYETDGHYWTVLIVAKMLKVRNARLIAEAAEAPDNIMTKDGYVERSTNTWLDFSLQVKDHAFTTISASEGADPAKERAFSRQLAQSADDYESFGKALHRLGDSYAHVNPSTGKMFFQGFGHLFKWKTPDKIKNRPNLYLSYVKDLAGVIKERTDATGDIDLFVFDYVAQSGFSTEKNIDIYRAESTILDGSGTFTISGDARHVEDFLSKRSEKGGFSYSSTTTSTISVSGSDPGSGAMNSSVTSTTFTITKD